MNKCFNYTEVMKNIDTIERISSVKIPLDEEASRFGAAVVMVGSFAPIHEGHVDAITSAKRALTSKGVAVETLVIAPNSSEYVVDKLGSEQGGWPYDRRIDRILSLPTIDRTPTYVDDLSGLAARENQINDYIPHTIEQFLGITPCRLFFVVGSDQLPSMEDHLSNGGRAVCVVRPGREYISDPCIESESWAMTALCDERLIVTTRENMRSDVSSTQIREGVR